MLTQIQAELAAALGQVDPHLPVYGSETVEQGLSPPCLMLAFGEITLLPQIGGRWRWHLPLEIRYFPRDYGNFGEIFPIAETLLGFFAKHSGKRQMFCVRDGILVVSAELEQLAVFGERETHDPMMQLTLQTNTGKETDE